MDNGNNYAIQEGFIKFITNKVIVETMLKLKQRD